MQIASYIRSSAFIALLLTSSTVFGQQASSTGVEVKDLATLIKTAGARRAEYIAAFKDLHAEEFQIAEQYGAKGLEKRREIVSDLIIYQSTLSEVSVVEYRNVRSVDGKLVANRDDRAEKLFARLAKATSPKKELERIDSESRRYDLNSSFYGYTLNQGYALDPENSPYFKFFQTGTEKIDGYETIVIDYQQSSPIPDLMVKLTLPKFLQGAEARLRGRLWLDTTTQRLRREESEFTITHPTLKTPLIFTRQEFSYGESQFGILTPTRLVMSTFTRGRNRPDGTPELLIAGKVTYTYGPFRRFEVTPEFRPGI